MRISSGAPASTSAGVSVMPSVTARTGKPKIFWTYRPEQQNRRKQRKRTASHAAKHRASRTRCAGPKQKKKTFGRAEGSLFHRFRTGVWTALFGSNATVVHLFESYWAALRGCAASQLSTRSRAASTSSVVMCMPTIWRLAAYCSCLGLAARAARSSQKYAST